MSSFMNILKEFAGWAISWELYGRISMDILIKNMSYFILQIWRLLTWFGSFIQWSTVYQDTLYLIGNFCGGKQHI